MKTPDVLCIVPVEEMPKPQDIQNAPLDDPAAIFILAHKMYTLCRKEDGLGLSAVQVGIPWRMFVVIWPWPMEARGFDVFLNCDYEPAGDTLIQSLEGCLSIPKGSSGDRPQFMVDRHERIHLTGQMMIWDKDIEFVPIDKYVREFPAIVFQHEIGHQKGILISSIGKPFHVQKVIPTNGC